MLSVFWCKSLLIELFSLMKKNNEGTKTSLAEFWMATRVQNSRTDYPSALIPMCRILIWAPRGRNDNPSEKHTSQRWVWNTNTDLCLLVCRQDEGGSAPELQTWDTLQYPESSTRRSIRSHTVTYPNTAARRWRHGGPLPCSMCWAAWNPDESCWGRALVGEIRICATGAQKRGCSATHSDTQTGCQGLPPPHTHTHTAWPR